MRKHYEEFLEFKSSHITLGTYKAYRRCLQKFDDFVDKPFCEITHQDIGRYHREIMQEYTDITIRHAFWIIRGCFRFWHGDESCLHPERIIVPKATPKLRHAATTEEFKIMTTLLEEHTPSGLQRLLMLHLLWNTGVRVGEAVSIKIDDVQNRKTVIRTEKTTRYRCIYWDDETQRLMDKYMALRIELKNRGDYLFTNLYPYGLHKPMLSTRSVERWINLLVKKAQIQSKINPHSFRHARIQRWFDLGLNAYEVIELSGHSSIMSLEHYTRHGVARVEANARRAMA